MGIPKGEGRSRGTRTRADRRSESGQEPPRTPHPANGQQGGSIGSPPVVDTRPVIDVHGTPVEHTSDAEHRRAVGVDRESEVVTKSVENLEEVRELDRGAPQTVLGSNELLGGNSANSNHRADITQVPYAPAEPAATGDREPRAQSRRDHAARLEAASVLDAPASLSESVAPPSRMSWALWLWVAAMSGIIGLAGIVALRDRGDTRQDGNTVQLSPPKSQKAESAAMPAVAEKSPAVTAVAPESAGAVSPPNEVAPVKAPAAVGAEQTSSEAEAAGTRAPARRSARRAEASGVEVSVQSVVEGATSELTKARVVGVPVEPGKPELPGAPTTAAPRIPGNPYDGEEQVANGKP